jgi:hypothetical protein
MFFNAFWCIYNIFHYISSIFNVFQCIYNIFQCISMYLNVFECISNLLIVYLWYKVRAPISFVYVGFYTM